MADVNWRRYDCNVCLAVGLSAAAVASAVAAWVLHSIGLPLVLLVILCLVVWGVLLMVVDGWCAGRYPDDPHAVAVAAAVENTMADARAAAEKAAADAKAAEEAAQARKDAETASGEAGENAGEGDGSRPEALDGPRGGVADDLKRIKGIGPKLEQVCNALGFYHFDQIAAWTADEIAWVDSNLEGFRGRVTRDDWVAQAKLLAAGGETEFSKRVDEGDVPSSQ